MDQFVCVRLVQANRLDLTRFQFDYDLTFAVFFMNADGTLYGRYGTRSSVEEADRLLSGNGFAESMKGALALHQGYPGNQQYLVGKQARPTEFKTPDDFPTLKGKYAETIDYQDAPARSCLHCHQVNDAQREIYRNAGKRIPDETLFIYPMPEVVGLTLDPETRATVSRVADGSRAAAAGFRAGDELITLDGQAILSIADVQWVLHNTAAAGNIDAVVRRGDIVRLTITLEEGWRRETDISWRVSSWPLRRMGTGGMVLKPLSKEEREQADLPAPQLAMRVDRVGQYGPHAAAKRAGFRQGDIVVSFNGQTTDMTRSEFLAMTVQETKPGQRVPVVVLRGGERLELMLPMQR